jgi:hypothetical protein
MRLARHLARADRAGSFQRSRRARRGGASPARALIAPASFQPSARSHVVSSNAITLEAKLSGDHLGRRTTSGSYIGSNAITLEAKRSGDHLGRRTTSGSYIGSNAITLESKRSSDHLGRRTTSGSYIGSTAITLEAKLSGDQLGRRTTSGSYITRPGHLQALRRRPRRRSACKSARRGTATSLHKPVRWRPHTTRSNRRLRESARRLVTGACPADQAGLDAPLTILCPVPALLSPDFLIGIPEEKIDGHRKPTAHDE